MSSVVIRRQMVLVVVLALSLASVAAAATPSKVFYEDTLPRTGVGQVTVKTQRAASFRVLLRVPTQGRARLYLLGANAPKGGPLIDTKTTPEGGPCEGAAGSFYCKGSYEPLPKGTYTWRIVWKGPVKAHVELTLRW